MPLPKISPAKQAILDITEEQLRKIEKKLAPFKELIQEQKDLLRVRSQILSERGGSRGTINPETIRAYFSKRDNAPASVSRIARKLSIDPSALRSHLHRGKDKSYLQNEEGDWSVIGGD
jgi:hypothetical protein